MKKFTSLRGRKVMVTGHSGFKGGWLCNVLDLMGAQVHGLSLEPEADDSLYSLLDIASRVPSFVGDIRDYGFVFRTLQDVSPDVIIHMAAQPLVIQSYLDPIETYETNVLGTVNLLQAANFTKSVKAIVNVTTDKCYENREWCWGYRETDTLGGYDPYSNSKACSELVTNAFRKSFFTLEQRNLAVATARSGNVIGGGDVSSNRLIPDVMRAAISGEAIDVRNPQATRPWQHVLEPLFGYVLLAGRLLENGKQFEGAWNFGPDESGNKTVAEVLKLLEEAWASPLDIVTKKGHFHEAGLLMLDCAKARSELNWMPTWTVETAVAKVVEWERAKMSGANVWDYTRKQVEEFLEAVEYA